MYKFENCEFESQLGHSLACFLSNVYKCIVAYIYIYIYIYIFIYIYIYFYNYSYLFLHIIHSIFVVYFQGPVKPFELRALNYLTNEFLLNNDYRLTAITFGEEVTDQVQFIFFLSSTSCIGSVNCVYQEGV